MIGYWTLGVGYSLFPWGFPEGDESKKKKGPEVKLRIPTRR
jgi:hypothetical protein